jgi:hypothetical protein
MHGVVVSKGYYIKECVMYMQRRNDKGIIYSQQIALITSHLVKHTANIIWSSRSIMVVMHLRTAHAHVRLSRWCC